MWMGSLILLQSCGLLGHGVIKSKTGHGMASLRCFPRKGLQKSNGECIPQLYTDICGPQQE